MAIRTLRKVRKPPTFKVERNPDGVVQDTELDRMAGFINKLHTLLASGVSVGTGESSSAAGNLSGQFIDWVFSATPDSLETIPHGLGKAPVAVIPVRMDRACIIYDTNFGAGWGYSQIQLYCNTASAKVKLLLLT